MPRKFNIKRYLPDIFAIAAGGLVIATGVEGYRAGKATALSSDENDELKYESKIALSKALLCGTGAIACIGGSRYYGCKREKELVAAGAVLSSYILKQRQNSDGGYVEPIYESATIESTGMGDDVFVEDFTGRKFYCSLEHVQQSIGQLSDDFKIRGFANLNDLYRYLGLQPTCAGQVLRWSVDSDVEPFYVDVEDALLDLNIFVDYYEGVGYVIKYPIPPLVPIGY